MATEYSQLLQPEGLKFRQPTPEPKLKEGKSILSCSPPSAQHRVQCLALNHMLILKKGCSKNKLILVQHHPQSQSNYSPFPVPSLPYTCQSLQLSYSYPSLALDYRRTLRREAVPFAFMPEYLAQSSCAVRADDLQHRVGKDGPTGILSAGGPPNQEMEHRFCLF